jgi:hypothetical protein
MAEDTQLEKSTLTQQALLATYSMSVSCLAWPLTVKADVLRSSEAMAFTEQCIISQKRELLIKPCVLNILNRRMKRHVVRGEAVYGLKGNKT